VEVRINSATHVETRRYRCRNCSHAAKAAVTGCGEGSETVLNDGGTAERRAEENARRDVSRALSIASCPKCGRRDGAAVRRW
jgi:DNA-directed RNA polymerase subunit RPC12/RpoP